MMNLTKHKLHTFSAALALGALSFGFTPAAMAVSTYDASASFSLTLTDVSCVGCTWDVTASGSGDALFSTSGDATATGSTSVIDPAVSMSILDTITQSSISSGTASNGFASTDALTDLNILVSNNSGQDVTFSFDYSIVLDAFADASAPGDFADASATVDFLDNSGVVDIFASTDALAEIPLQLLATGTGTVFDSGTFTFTLADGQTNLISGFVDSFGSASAVPVPAAVWLFGSGLLGLVGVARRKQAA